MEITNSHQILTLRKNNTITSSKRMCHSLVILLVVILTSSVVSACVNETAVVNKTVITPVDSSIDEIGIRLLSTDVSVGMNRLAFGLIEKGKGPIKDTPVSLNIFYLDGDNPNEAIDVLVPKYVEWPSGKTGVYTTNVNFKEKGRWGLGIVIDSNDGVRTASALIEVSATSTAPFAGSIAPYSNTKSLTLENPIESITSDPNPYLPLYKLTLQQALDSTLPSVVVFATPAYCVTATCGPQLEIIKDLHRSHNESINFIHIETYENPQDIRGNLSNGIISTAVKEWNLPSEPWTFLINSEGIVVERYEGLVTTEEILDVLPSLR